MKKFFAIMAIFVSLSFMIVPVGDAKVVVPNYEVVSWDYINQGPCVRGVFESESQAKEFHGQVVANMVKIGFHPELASEYVYVGEGGNDYKAWVNGRIAAVEEGISITKTLFN